MEIDVNGERRGGQALGGGWTRIMPPLGGQPHHSAPNVITVQFHYRGSDTPTTRRIGQTDATSPADLQVISAGMDTGNEGEIYVDGRPEAVNRRGYNLVAIDAVSGHMLWSELFNPFASPAESHRLAEAIGRLPAGTIVAATVKDEASRELTVEAIAALRSLGGTEDIRGRYRVS